MTRELQRYIESLQVRVYRIIDGSTVLAEETHRDTVDSYALLRRPLQVSVRMNGEKAVTVYTPWLPSAEPDVRLALSSIVCEDEACFEQKYAYSRYYLLEHLRKYLTPEEVDQATGHPSPKPKVKDDHGSGFGDGHSRLSLN